MGRQEPSRGLQPAAVRKDVRAKKARLTMSRDVPAILRSDARARAGVAATELIANPIISYDTEMTGHVSLVVADTLEAAKHLCDGLSKYKGKKHRVGVLNMASLLRPGGGVLNGATSQEESLCLRTTLYPALKEEFYRLPDVGGIYTPDVLVFRSWDKEASDLPKGERFYVDVISAGMLRDPECEYVDETTRQYTNLTDRDLVEQKMKSVLSVAKSRGITKLVLGAWGCGAYGNPLNEIAAIWCKVLVGDTIDKTRPQPRSWPVAGGADTKIQIVFAVSDDMLARKFAGYFGSDLLTGYVEHTRANEANSGDELEDNNWIASSISAEHQARIVELEDQINQSRSPLLRERLSSILAKLQSDTSS